eukprot:3106211-Lingulodinium_polyedra.AAC.1
MECASVRFASRCGGRRLIRPDLCAALAACCAAMRLDRPSAAAAACKSHVCASHARAGKTVVRMECASRCE